MAARRGPIESEAERTVAEPTSVIRGPPNIANAVRTVEPVLAYVVVPSARLPIEIAANDADRAKKSARNSGSEKMSR